MCRSNTCSKSSRPVTGNEQQSSEQFNWQSYDVRNSEVEVAHYPLSAWLAATKLNISMEFRLHKFTDNRLM